ncbi:hypothetical protein AVEN_60784-1 [Araneus ventricosus]|uniref:Sushi domain-containing protein n=1 Tax=Araneus ventricosus TaxID=182803 RepID=A0A4Y2VII9_ARAVE|nr:hypothetical protein AVEN_262543-1 [Araneus ventricosus]GBO24034.1 hypothetical protein AVEN_204433-1 [Araneus ventricosus]GBO24436.1 hypothetical protein AVEN_96326-1 [Araneus ventricosus]GBO24441.1 hypothetical protein AVEN_60784-1 [Araneus ventricosus]
MCALPNNRTLVVNDFSGTNRMCSIGLKRINRLFFFLTACPPPDFPKRGKYEPEKAEYEAGTRIKYTCNDGLAMFVEDRWNGFYKMVTCQSSGNWSEGTPFCGK